MKIELLYSEINNHFGDRGHVDLLKSLFPEALFIETPLVHQPSFTKEKIDLIYLGPGSEKSQEKILERLTPYKEYIKEEMEKETAMLFFGNSAEILGKQIEDFPALGLFDYTAKRQMMKRINALFLGKLEEADFDIVAFRSQFTQVYAGEKDYPLFKTLRGEGRNTEDKNEGILYKNFLASHLMGPLLIMNPLLLQWYLRRIGKDRPIPHFDTMMEAYEIRRKEFHDPKTTL